ncbi:MAG: BrnT family toxin [Pseudomonadota bacterium]
MDFVVGIFEWDVEKERGNVEKHGVDFLMAMQAFLDEERLIATDELHSEREPRFFCVGQAKGQVLTVRFTRRGRRIRILGAGYWRKGRALYEKANSKR